MNAFMYMENKKEASASASSYVINDLTRLGTGCSTFVLTDYTLCVFCMHLNPFLSTFFALIRSQVLNKVRYN